VFLANDFVSIICLTVSMYCISTEQDMHTAHNKLTIDCAN